MQGLYQVAILKEPLQLTGVPLGEVHMLSHVSKALTNGSVASLPLQQSSCTQRLGLYVSSKQLVLQLIIKDMLAIRMVMLMPLTTQTLQG